MGVLLVAGFLASAVLVGRMALDLSTLDWSMAVVIWGCALSFLAITGTNVVSSLRGVKTSQELAWGKRLALAVVVPVAYLASVLDCMGLTFHGCTSTCSVLMQGVAPAAGALVLVHGLTAARGPLMAALAVSFGLLVPNCVCYNPVNAHWIDLWGRSPACFAGSHGVTLIAIAALHTGRLVVPSLWLAWGTTVAMLAFWVGHHYYEYPW